MDRAALAEAHRRILAGERATLFVSRENEAAARALVAKMSSALQARITIKVAR